jgi:xylulokinase
VGGGSRSELWLRIIATALGLPIDVPAAGDFGGAFGAARLGLIAATGENFARICTPPRIAKSIKPEAKARDAYEIAYDRYIEIYPAIREI